LGVASDAGDDGERGRVAAMPRRETVARVIGDFGTAD
jgi:hypothetical protein